MFEAYFEVFYLLLMLLVTIENSSLCVYGYQLLPLATSYFVENNRKFDASGIFWGFLFLVCVGELMAIEDTPLSAHIYQLLLLATSYLVGNNRDFDASGIFWGVLLIVGGGELIAIEDPSLMPMVTSCCP